MVPQLVRTIPLTLPLSAAGSDNGESAHHALKSKHWPNRLLDSRNRAACMVSQSQHMLSCCRVAAKGSQSTTMGSTVTSSDSVESSPMRQIQSSNICKPLDWSCSSKKSVFGFCVTEAIPKGLERDQVTHNRSDLDQSRTC